MGPTQFQSTSLNLGLQQLQIHAQSRDHVSMMKFRASQVNILIGIL